MMSLNVESVSRLFIQPENSFGIVENAKCPPGALAMLFPGAAH